MREFHPRQVANHGPMRVQRALRIAGGPRCIADERGLVGAGVDRGEGVAGGVQPLPKVDDGVAVPLGAGDENYLQVRQVAQDGLDFAQVLRIGN